MINKTSLPQILPFQWHRDLKWVASSPLLCRFPEFTPTLPKANFLSEQATEPPGNIPPLTSRFLGPYFELLWRYLIEHSSNLELLYQGLQIHQKGRTLGEFDFILKSKSHGEAIHQEVAVKYYLGLPHQEHSSVWYGPNMTDRLDLKVDKILSEQILFSRNKTAIDRLSEMDITRIKPEIMMKGYLFHPWQEELTYPDYVAPEAITGFWLTIDNLDRLYKQADRWTILPKLEWLSPAKKQYSDTLNQEEMKHRISGYLATNYAQLICAMDQDKNNLWSETGRFFIVNNNWPQSARNTLVSHPLKEIPSGKF